MRLLTLRSVTPEGVINRNVWSATKRADLLFEQVCPFCVRYCYAGVIELLCLAGRIGDPSILHNADEAHTTTEVAVTTVLRTEA